jgi:hypothetical protein
MASSTIQKQIDDPATSHMGSRLAAVVEDVRIAAAGIFKGIGENGQALEGSFVVHASSQLHDHSGVARQPGWINGDRTEGVANNITQQAGPQSLVLLAMPSLGVESIVRDVF